MHSAKLVSGLEGLQSNASPLPRAMIGASGGWDWALEGSTIKNMRKSHFLKTDWLCGGMHSGDGQTHSASRLPAVRWMGQCRSRSKLMARRGLAMVKQEHVAAEAEQGSQC